MNRHPGIHHFRTSHHLTTVARREIARVNLLLTRAERDCVDWYAEATAVFPATTEIGALIRSDIPNTDQYNPPTPAPVIPPAA